MIVAATNHPEILDHALFRRFDDVVQYQLPTPEQALELIRIRLGAFTPKPFRKDVLATHAVGLSYAELCRAVDESIKDSIMRDETKVQIASLKKALEERRTINTNLTT
jgi:AAA+ superfamily predicted ATPase